MRNKVLEIKKTYFRWIMKLTIVANVTDMKTREILLRFTSSAVPMAVGTTAKRRIHMFFISN